MIARTNLPREVREAMDAAERATRALAWQVRQALVAEPPGTLTDAGRVAAWRAGRNRVVAQVLDVLDAAGAPADGDQRHNMPRQFTPPAVTDAMVQAAINAALDLRYGDHPLDTHRHHDAKPGVRDELGGYSSKCPLCRVAGSHPSIAEPARERVFRAALEAAIAAGTPSDGEDQ